MRRRIKTGYAIKESENTQRSNNIKFVTSRKNSHDLGLMLNHKLNPISHGGIASKVDTPKY
tara:strand:+ start:392 stop:574 length:183 start_codon:yes stop_codon:yes gene_type:complete